MKLAGTIALSVGMLLLVSSYSLPEEAELIRAFLDSPDIIRAQEEAAKNRLEPARIETISYASLCGAVGCQFSVLVVQHLERKGTNPQTASLLGLVHVGARGEISRVEHVVLAPFAEKDDS